VQDFTQLQSLSLEQQQKQLRDLVGRGQTIAAIYIARKMHGCSLAEAKEIVERLIRPA
jgi:ribosomal protein L7/L12